MQKMVSLSTTALFVLLLVREHERASAFAPLLPAAKPPAPPSSSSSSSLDATRLVWLTGHEDLRLHDHGGFANAVRDAASNSEEEDEDDVILPVFVLDPKIHLRSKPAACVARLRNCLASLEGEIAIAAAASSSSSLSLSSATRVAVAPLVIRTGAASWVLPSLAKEVGATACHVVADDVVEEMRQSQRRTCESLAEMGVDVRRWTNALRPSAPWAEGGSKAPTLMPSFYPDYCKIADDISIVPPIENVLSGTTGAVGDKQMVAPSEGVPSLSELLDMAKSATPTAVLQHRSAYPNTEPYEKIISDRWTTEKNAQRALDEYCRSGKDNFADKHFLSSDAAGGERRSKYAAAAARIARGGSRPSATLALREAPARAFSAALSLGALSARDVADAARNRSPVTPPLWVGDGSGGLTAVDDRNRAGLFPSDDPLWGRSSEGSLSDVVEWREWFRLLADRSLTLQEKGEPATSGGEKAMAGDPREAGKVHYWRFKQQHLVRYLTWPAGKDYNAEKDAPTMLLVHGFAASAEQWERLVYSLRQQGVEKNGKDVLPPIYAVDLLGFGHSEKPGLSYTQYLWEAQLVDFAVEVMEAVPMVMVGNSIGGGLSAGAAATLGKDICKGLVLCNTAGILEDPGNYTGYSFEKTTARNDNIRSHTEAAMEGNPNEAPYSPIPIVGASALDLFGTGIIKLIYPQIEQRLSLIYGNRIENADPAVVYAIQQSAQHPGSANVIGSGQKLAPNRPLNEVLVEVTDGGFNVLVVKGLEDQVSSPQVAKSRAELFSRLNPGKVVVEPVSDAGHCPHDEKPDLVAKSILKWMPSLTNDMTAASQSTTERADSKPEEIMADV